MKLKCVYSSEFSKNPLFIEGNMYEVITTVDDKHYHVTTEIGKSIYVPLNGKIWRFKIVSEEQQDEKNRKEDILFEIESLISQLNNEFNKLKKLI